MSDSQRPNSPEPTFDVPDLELEPVARAPRLAPPAGPAAARTKSAPSAHEQLFGSSIDFGDDLDDFEFERTSQPIAHVPGRTAPRQAAAKRAEATVAEGAEPNWPTGRAPQAAELSIDPLELAILADYGPPPEAVPLTLAYAYRVFTRQRELKRQLIPLAAECERAQFEREATLAELARVVRPAAEQIPEFRRFFGPLLELEQVAAQRGQALTSINAQLGAESEQLDAELAQLAGQIEAEQRLESAAQSQLDDREANAKRADAKLKRVQIEMRAVTQVAEQKLGPQGGTMPDAEAAQFAALEQRAQAMQPEVAQARAEFEQAKQALTQRRARIDALRQNERQISRKKQLLGGAYQQEVSLRSQGVSENEIAQRAALVELARAVLAARGRIELPEPWLERVRSVSDHADKLIMRAEMQRRAIHAYDAGRAGQGVRLACTAVGLLLVLFVFKLVF